jgi:hypothetical protein
MNECLGVHECDLCPLGEGPEGNRELSIRGVPGVVYAAPLLVSHYVSVHGYLPPREFVDAVLSVRRHRRTSGSVWARAGPWVMGACAAGRG